MNVKYWMFSVCLVLSGCTTSLVTGKKKLLGVVPIPFTGPPEPPVQDDKLLVLVHQLEKFSWIGIILVVLGAFWWKMSGGATGLGKLAVLVGSVFIALAFFLPRIAGWVTVAVVLSLFLAVGYQVWFRFFKKG